MPNLHRKVLQRNLIKKWKVLKGDLVHITEGRDAGKQGIVKKVFRSSNRLIVEGCNLVKKHVKKSKDNAGYVTSIPAPIHYSNVALVCPQTGKPTKIGYKYLEDGTKVRVAKVSGVVVPKPEILTKKRTTPSNPDKDTPGEEVARQSFHENELIDLKNSYLKKLEMEHYAKLQKAWEAQNKQDLKQYYRDQVFQRDVFKRAQHLMEERQRQRTLQGQLEQQEQVQQEAIDPAKAEVQQ